MASFDLPLSSRCTVYPEDKSVVGNLKLSVSDLPFLLCEYIKMGNLFESPPFTISELLLQLKTSLSRALTYFPPLAGRLITDDNGFVYINCNDAGVDLIHADGSSLSIKDLTESAHGDLPEAVNKCFPLDHTLGYEGHFKPLLIVQVTELANGVFIAVNMSHAVADGISFTNFFNSFAELSRGLTQINHPPDFHRDNIFMSMAVPKFPSIIPSLTSFCEDPVRKKIFKFSRTSIQKLKTEVNKMEGKNNEISSLQCLSALLWRGVTRARKLPPSKTTTFSFAVNCRHRINPKLDPFYFGTAVQNITATATADEVVKNDMFWCATQLNKIVTAHDDSAVRRLVEAWERDPQLPTIQKLDGTRIIVVCSPRFAMYENDFSWGKPIAILNGSVLKRDGSVIALPSRDGGTDFEIILAPETMAGLEADPEFMLYVSTSGY